MRPGLRVAEGACPLVRGCCWSLPVEFLLTGADGLEPVTPGYGHAICISTEKTFCEDDRLFLDAKFNLKVSKLPLQKRE